jgi:Magnesium chelatase, subunit ChlI
MSCRRSAHNVLLLGPPGAGKSRLVRRLTTILPEMTLAEAIDTTRIHRVAGRTGGRTALVTSRPFRAPQQTSSAVGLIGSGQIPLPGEVTLAHHGMRCLDELPECRRHVLEVLRQPLEGGITQIPSPARPKPPCFGGLSETDDDHEGFGQSPVAAYHRDGHHTRCVTAALIRSKICSHLMLFA